MKVLNGKHLRSTEHEEWLGAWDKCSWCSGYGIKTGAGGDPIDCYHCGWSGIERARDSKGRFTNPRLTAKFQAGMI